LAFAPNAFCPLYTGPLMAVNPGWWEHVDAYVTEAWLRLAQDHADLDSTTLVCKWLRALGIPGVLLITGQHMPFWHAPIASQEMRLHAAVAKGNGRPILGPCGVGAYPSAATHQEGLRTMRQANEFYTADAPTDSTREPARYIGVVWSEDSRNFYEPGEGASGYRYEFLGICRALTESHRVFNLLLPDRLHSAQDLAGYELIIMPNTACMDEPLANLIREYVRGGGRLLCTWETSLCDRRGGQRDDFLLADVLGLRYSGKYPTPAFYVEREDEPTVALGQATIVTPTTAETLARLVAPDPDYPDSLDDLIPGPLTEHPMLTVNRFGQGVAWYVAGPIACSAYRTGYYQTMQLIEEIIGRTGLSAWMTVSAPPTVEVSVERDAGGRLYVHLANKTAPAYLPGRAITRSIDTLIPVADVRLTFDGHGTARCVSPVDGKVTVTHSTDRVECTIPRLDDYLLLEVTL
ncbi:MAG: hypothetical protein GX601_13245, partial [Anaerolineales bacterium]|nr:hypothetical protein [Anaerolineales bacterium]